MKNVINIWIIFYLHIVLCVRCGSKCPFDILVLPHSARGPQQLLLLRELSFLLGGGLSVCDGRPPILCGLPLCLRGKIWSPLCLRRKIRPPGTFCSPRTTDGHGRYHSSRCHTQLTTFCRFFWDRAS